MDNFDRRFRDPGLSFRLSHPAILLADFERRQRGDEFLRFQTHGDDFADEFYDIVRFVLAVWVVGGTHSDTTVFCPR
jgi:hypothetical protein